MEKLERVGIGNSFSAIALPSVKKGVTSSHVWLNWAFEEDLMMWWKIFASSWNGAAIIIITG